MANKLVDVGSVCGRLFDGMPEEFFIEYNRLKAEGLSFETATAAAWEILAKRGIQKVDPLAQPL